MTRHRERLVKRKDGRRHLTVDGRQRQLTATAMAGGSAAIDGAAVAINSGNGASGSG
jgi:hypothetical protein